ncbi:MAG: phytanoyl-CoA dioxygenase family protein [Rhodospirillaceae bacterium]|mgnify:CR=1 FL=1|jgi:non-haem Fe2+, alpha-ketoglutarate-dependent halogenase|nr:phytanoyl-CoA dioxygenase family protein [Rhodospirillaceae bacterium]MBT4489995.1 phytanoyl-CoA dioxygenase family protein [Rhodospirillaceae bacterium]MBT5191363.1 phytanoyl-CoA dioxygenase family protein [Rhodospirillaceae bacterium]MBT5898182.1 phytanoyl-CoA dioxygenase family protein [Rhodospirillaceae bacterium]MBT6426865.1 phytanoyl-CoA dioxygenase family protein [Rhodospirillaceae bacterium]
MGKRLTENQVNQYEDAGYVHPIPVLSAEEVRAARAEIEAFETKTGKTLDYPEKSKSYLLFDWAENLVRHPAILDAVEDLIGPDILVYHTTMWIKDAGTPGYILWHQDGTYFFLDQPLHVTAWIALSEASVDSGCMHVLPGTQDLGQLDHQDDPGEHNLILRGQAIFGRFDDEVGIPMPLQAGEMSLHNTDLVHCSHPNRAADRRMGFGISYIPAHVRDVGTPPGSAMLVRGRDHGNFRPEQRIGAALSAEAYENHAQLMTQFRSRQDSGASIGRQVSYSEVS